MSASKNLGKVFMTPKGIWDKNSNYTKLDIVTNKVGKISCGYIATTDIEKNIEITDNRWLKLFELLDGDLTEEYKAVQTDVTNKATAVNTNKKAVDLIYSQMQKLYDVEISTTTPTNERTGLWINPDDISGVINIPEIKDDEVSDVDTWSSKKIDNVTNSLKEDISTKITKFYASSQGETHLADSDNGKIMDMMLYGRSEQKQYSGKNLLNPTLQTTTQNSVTCTANGDGTYTLNGSNANIPSAFTLGTVYLIKDKKYKMAGCHANPGKAYLQLRTPEPDNVTYKNDYSSGVEFVIPKSGKYIVRIYYDVETYNNLLFKPMLTTDLTATYDDFEPYTGGIPSPNPDYPQEIKSVVNPTMKVCGKNLFDKNNCYDNKWIKDLQGNLGISNGFFTTNHIFVKKGATVAIRKTGTARRGYFNISKTKFTYTESTNTTFTAIEDCWLMVSCNKAITPIEDFQIELGSTSTAYEPYHEQTVTLPYTLNAIPVESGGNVTIDGQQYIADYVDVERGKLVRMVGECVISDMNQITRITTNTFFVYGMDDVFVISDNSDDIARLQTTKYQGVALVDRTDNKYIYRCWLSTHDNLKPIAFHSNTDDLSAFKNEVYGTRIIYQLANPTEIDLTPEEIAAFKSLATYYPVTNIFINSEQLDGYTVFNYPVSMENGWNYVKQQIGDTRDYIYDMDARAQDTDLQAAEAYVNSEYAVALTELEV